MNKIKTLSAVSNANLRDCFIKYFAFGRASEKDYSFDTKTQRKVNVIEILFSYQKEVYTAMISFNENNEVNEEYSVLYTAIGKRKDCSIEEIKEFYQNNNSFIRELLLSTISTAENFTQQ